MPVQVIGAPPAPVEHSLQLGADRVSAKAPYQQLSGPPQAERLCRCQQGTLVIAGKLLRQRVHDHRYRFGRRRGSEAIQLAAFENLGEEPLVTLRYRLAASVLRLPAKLAEIERVPLPTRNESAAGEPRAMLLQVWVQAPARESGRAGRGRRHPPPATLFARSRRARIRTDAASGPREAGRCHFPAPASPPRSDWPPFSNRGQAPSRQPSPRPSVAAGPWFSPRSGGA